jgi:hypothetical protein
MLKPNISSNMPFKSKTIGLVLDRGNNNPPELRAITRQPEASTFTRTETGLVVVRLQSFQPTRGKFHQRDFEGTVSRHHDEVARILSQNSNHIDLFMGDMLVYEFGSYAVCMYNTYVMGKGSRLRWEAIRCIGGFTTPPHIKKSLAEAAQVFQKIGTVPDEDLLIPDWSERYRPATRRRRRKRTAKQKKTQYENHTYRRQESKTEMVHSTMVESHQSQS